MRGDYKDKKVIFLKKEKDEEDVGFGILHMSWIFFKGVLLG